MEFPTFLCPLFTNHNSYLHRIKINKIQYNRILTINVGIQIIIKIYPESRILHSCKTQITNYALLLLLQLITLIKYPPPPPSC